MAVPGAAEYLTTPGGTQTSRSWSRCSHRRSELGSVGPLLHMTQCTRGWIVLLGAVAPERYRSSGEGPSCVTAVTQRRTMGCH